MECIWCRPMPRGAGRCWPRQRPRVRVRSWQRPKRCWGQVPLEGRVVVADALLTQREVCQQIVAGGEDYLLPVKENQPALRQDLVEVFPPTGN